MAGPRRPSWPFEPARPGGFAPAGRASGGSGSLGAAPPVFRIGASVSLRLAAAVVGALALGLVGLGGPAAWTRQSASGRIHTASQWRSAADRSAGHAPEGRSVPGRSVPGHAVPGQGAAGPAIAEPVTLVLGAGLDGRGGPSPFLAARLDLAHELYRRGATRVLLLSGSRRGADYDEPTVMRDYLLARGVPAEHLVTDGEGHDTYASCYRARHVYDVRSMLVVSQTYHLPRALAICRHLGVDAVGVGDETARSFEMTWRGGELREYPANVKAVWNVVAHRHPAQLADDPPDAAVREALVATTR